MWSRNSSVQSKTCVLSSLTCTHSTYTLRLGQAAGDPHIPASWRSRRLARREANGGIDQTPQLPAKIIYKLSYQKQGHPSEGDLFSGFLHQFGVVDIVGNHVCSTRPFGSTAHLFTDPLCLKIGQQDPVASPEHRYLHCTAMGLEGLPLLDISYTDGIPTPAELLETILHSMIGKCDPASAFRGQLSGPLATPCTCEHYVLLLMYIL